MKAVLLVASGLLVPPGAAAQDPVPSVRTLEHPGGGSPVCIRIEDAGVITEDGRGVVTGDVPQARGGVEALARSRRVLDGFAEPGR
jgi:hypothetical protein